MKFLSKREEGRIESELAEARENERNLVNAMCSMYSEVAQLALFAGLEWPRPDAAAPADVMAGHVADMASGIRNVMSRLSGDVAQARGEAARQKARADFHEEARRRQPA